MDTQSLAELTQYKTSPSIKEGKAVIIISLRKKLSKSLLYALKPEVKQGRATFTKVKLVQIKKGVELRLKAREISNLRAAINTYLGLIRAVVETLEQIECE